MDASFRLVSFETWRQYPFTMRRWFVWVLEVTVASMGIWLVSMSWWSWVIVGAILAVDYLWTCRRISTGASAPPS